MYHVEDRPHDLKTGVEVDELDAQLFIFDDLAYVVVHNDPRQSRAVWPGALWASSAAARSTPAVMAAA